MLNQKYLFAYNVGNIKYGINGINGNYIYNDNVYVIDANNLEDLINKILNSEKIINKLFKPQIINDKWSIYPMELFEDIYIDENFYEKFKEYYGSQEAIENNKLFNDIKSIDCPDEFGLYFLGNVDDYIRTEYINQIDLTNKELLVNTTFKNDQLIENFPFDINNNYLIFQNDNTELLMQNTQRIILNLECF